MPSWSKPRHRIWIPVFLSHLCSLAPVYKFIVSYPRVDPLFLVRLLPTPETTGPARLIVKLKKNKKKSHSEMALTLCIYLFSFRNSNCTETSAPTFPLSKWQRNNAPCDAEQRILWQVEATWTMWNMLWKENLPIEWIQKSTVRTKIKPTVLTPSSKTITFRSLEVFRL